MSTEKINFKICLSGTYWDKKPHYTISVDDTEYVNAYITQASGEVEYVKFECEVTEDEKHVLKIRFDNKEDSDVVKDNPGEQDNFTIVKDMLLNVIDIEADDIELGALAQMTSVFKYDKPQDFPEPGTTELPYCVNLGFNGTYELEFTSPFYLWLLEKI
jgi:hypothetical protein